MTDITAEEMVTDRVAEAIGPGYVVMSAFLVVETLSEDGRVLHTLRSTDTPTWSALGMLQSAILVVEQDDVMSRISEEEEQ